MISPGDTRGESGNDPSWTASDSDVAQGNGQDKLAASPSDVAPAHGKGKGKQSNRCDEATIKEMRSEGGAF